MRLLMKTIDILDRVIVVICVVMLIAMTCIAGIQCFSRYVLSKGFIWSEEACRYLFCWVTLLGSACCVKRKKHVAMTLLVGAVKPAVRKTLVIIVHALSCVMSAVMIIYGWQLSSIAAMQFSPALRISMGIVYMVVPISGALMLLFTVGNALNDVRCPAEQIEIGGGE